MARTLPSWCQPDSDAGGVGKGVIKRRGAQRHKGLGIFNQYLCQYAANGGSKQPDVQKGKMATE